MTKTQKKAAIRLAKKAARQSNNSKRMYAVLNDGTVEFIKSK